MNGTVINKQELSELFKKNPNHVPGLGGEYSSSDDGEEDTVTTATKHSITTSDIIQRLKMESASNTPTYMPTPITPPDETPAVAVKRSKKQSDATESSEENVPAAVVEKKSLSLKRKTPKKIISSPSSEGGEKKTNTVASNGGDKTPSPEAVGSPSLLEVRDEKIIITHTPQKSSFDVNLRISTKYYKNILPIFNKGVRVELYTQRDKSEFIWTNVVIKNMESLKFPMAIYKIINVDENIIKNLTASINVPSNASKEAMANGQSDKNHKIYDETSLFRLDNEGNIFIDGRVALRKNIIYVYNLTLNVIFVNSYVNIHSSSYRCALNVRSDNNYVACLVITALDNCVIEDGVKLMYKIN